MNAYTSTTVYDTDEQLEKLHAYTVWVKELGPYYVLKILQQIWLSVNIFGIKLN